MIKMTSDFTLPQLWTAVHSCILFPQKCLHKILFQLTVEGGRRGSCPLQIFKPSAVSGSGPVRSGDFYHGVRTFKSSVVARCFQFVLLLFVNVYVHFFQHFTKSLSRCYTFRRCSLVFHDFFSCTKSSFQKGGHSILSSLFSHIISF